MNLYNRRGKPTDHEVPPEKPVSAAAAPNGPPMGRKVNGLQQVIDLLQAADPEFRKSLLRRIVSENPELGEKLRMHFSR